MAISKTPREILGFSGLRAAVSCAILLLTVFLQFFTSNTILNRLDGIGYDAKLSYAPPIPESLANIQVVDIDERTLLEVERMPWRRNLYAQLTDKLTELGAIVIVYDVLFSEPQPNPAEPVLDSLMKEGRLPGNQANDAERILREFDYDMTFARSIGQNEIVLGTLLHQQSDIRKGILSRQSVQQETFATIDRVYQYEGYSGVIAPLASASAGQGFMNSVEDADGFVRRSALVAKVGDTYYPSLAAEAFRVYSLVETIEPQWETAGNERFLSGVRFGNQIIPTDNQGRVLIPFKGRQGTYPYTSAVDVLKGTISSSKFEQAVVFIGTSASGLADLRVTPMAVNFPGVEIHATVFESLFAPERLIYRPDWWEGALALQLVLITVVIVLGFSYLGPVTMSLASVLMLVLTIWMNLFFWQQFSIDLPIISPLILTAFLSILFIISGFLSEAKRRRQVKAIFDQYVPPAHIDELLTSNDNSLAGEKRELTVMFSDIRSFTTISESMAAHELKQWLNQFFSPITKVIFENDGTIDKYVGDMVMAFWGAPLNDPEHANKAVKAAFDMIKALESLNKQFSRANQPEANIGIGLNTGEMNVGDMGSDYRRAYTVIGDAVNLGSRLEGLTKYYGLSILVSEETCKQATKFQFLMIDKVKVKGKHKPVTIYTPLQISETHSDNALDQAYSEALQHYFASEFDTALVQFTALKNTYHLPVVVDLYIERCHFFIQNPPPEDWDGSFTHTSK
ncbi:CHASE2 domain-containing protein [Alteromonas facilis]|uniref:CHASE2 domain-containing protein n=1 Tax=Alteromonas facilis TaxID=2048004 RepID=UPI000C293D20|nr:adenylate/guanylate cyclase domain-containing protein [Alteromonas facilis]